MNVRKFITNLDSLQKAGLDFVKHDNDQKAVYQATMVNMYLNGNSTKAISESSGVSPSTINLWVKIADEKGFDALRNSSPPGRPSQLNEQQLEEVRIAVLSPPESFNYHVWEGKTVSDFIFKRFNVKLGVRQCQNILRNKLNLSLIRPQTLPAKGKDNTEEREEFKKK